MKIITSVLLVSALLFVSFSKSMVCISYILNKDFITNYLCENRNKPQLHCNGKCHLMKTLKEEDKRGNQPSDVNSNFEIQLFAEKTAGFDFVTYCSGRITFSYSDGKTEFPVFAVFRPPRV